MAVRTKALSLLSPPSCFGPTPGEEDLAAIHRLCLEPVPAEGLYVRRMALANTRLDRTYERFTPEVLQRLAQTLVGKSLLISHNTRELATGLFYRADVQRAPDGESELVAYFYLPVIPANEEVRQLIDAGVIRHVSIGFRYDQRLCSVCDMDYWSCPHLPGDTTDGGQLVTFVYGGDLSKFESREGSLVYLGAQRDAEIIKEWPMENEKALARIRELEAERDSLQKQLAAFTERAGVSLRIEEERDRLKAECTALKEQLAAVAGSEHLTDETRALVEDGKLYRADLRAEVTRLAGIVKTEAEASLLLTALPHAPAAQLKELVASYQARADEKYPPKPVGEPPAAEDPPPPTPASPMRPLRVV